MVDAALLALRAVTGGLLAGHGAQKVFGAFEGPGPEGTRGMAKHLGFEPPHVWGPVAGLSELVGGGLTAVGALNPIGPLTSTAPLIIASTTVHGGKPVWATKGGPELPLVYMASFATIALAGPGRFSVDRLLGIRLPRWVGALTLAGVAGGTAFALATRSRQQPPAQQAPQPEQKEIELRGAQERERSEAPQPAS